MKTNEGTVDRAVRIVIGLLLIGLTLNETIGAWGWIGIIPLATGLTGICLLYQLFGVNTCPSKGRKE